MMKVLIDAVKLFQDQGRGLLVKDVLVWSLIDVFVLEVVEKNNKNFLGPHTQKVKIETLLLRLPCLSLCSFVSSFVTRLYVSHDFPTTKLKKRDV